MRACRFAAVAAKALVFEIQQLYFWGLAFRVMAPCALQIAALKKYSCPNTGTIYKGVPLDIKYHTSAHSITLFKADYIS